MVILCISDTGWKILGVYACVHVCACIDRHLHEGGRSSLALVSQKVVETHYYASLTYCHLLLS